MNIYSFEGPQSEGMKLSPASFAYYQETKRKKRKVKKKKAKL